MTTAEKNVRSAQAFDIFKLLVANLIDKDANAWDFQPLAAKACGAVEVFHDLVQQRYPTNVVGGQLEPTAESSQQQPPPAPGVATPWGT